MARILVVDDEQSLLDTLRYTLAKQGYEVVTASDGEAALASARLGKPDLILLDLMLPKLDGMEVCRILRGESAVPILILTARDEEIDRVFGLEMGADDYITKPFSLRELVARVKATLRRVEMERAARADDAQSILKEGSLQLDLHARRVQLGPMPLHLKPKEFDLLAFLMRHPGRAFSRDQLLEQVWGYAYSGDTRTVDVHIRWLREKIETDPSSPELIETVRGLGYRFRG